MSKKVIENPHVERWLGDRKGKSQDSEDQPLFEVLDAMYAAGPSRKDQLQAQASLHRKLEDSIHQVYYDVLESTSIGQVMVAVTREGVVSIEFNVEEKEFVGNLKINRRTRVSRSAERVKSALRQIRDYLDGKRSRFNLSLDLSRLTDFQCRVLLATSQIPRGQVVSYAEIARRIGNPSASRAVGQALARNPVPILIPCHRVVASDGSLTGYSGGGGIQTKAKLLKLEGALLE